MTDLPTITSRADAEARREFPSMFRRDETEVRLPFTYNVPSDDGRPVIYDLECEVVVTVYLDGGQPAFDCHAVYLDDVDLLTQRSPTLKNLGCLISEAAQSDEDIQEQGMLAAGISFNGDGPNDPDGYFARRIV